MNLDDDELLVTKHKRKLISYTKQVASGKLDKNFYNAYCELYDLLCEYMNAYNKLEETNTKIYEATYETDLLASKHITKEEYNKLKEERDKLKEKCIYLQDKLDNLEYASNRVAEELNKYRKLYFEEKEKKYNITIPLKDTGLKDIEYYYKKGDKWYAHYKETQVDKTKEKELEEQAKSKVTENELKDMIIGMLE